MTDKTDLSYVHGHRARLREKFVETRLVDYELLELLLSYAIPRCDVKPIVKSLLAKFGGMHQTLNAPIDELEKIVGISNNTAIFLKALREVSLREYQKTMSEKPLLCNNDLIANYCRMLLGDKTTEEIHVLYLNAKQQLIEDECHSRGTTNWSAVHPREIIKRALNLDATSIILMHNHPGGSQNFSDDDKLITKALDKMCRSVDIALSDHLMIAGSKIISAKGLFII
ncbi:MAG: DNA repair protein RadC [Rickettsiales bacterium]|jgi:DNA repair protein RadC|nr:DNA repair protein RadC [Rickettsiales bacterium]